MPTVNCGFSNPYELVRHGPTIAVAIGFDSDYRPGAGVRPNLPPDTYPALVDTGATRSCIDSALAETLNLPIVGRNEIGGAGGLTEVSVYLAQIYVPELRSAIYGRFAGVHLQVSSAPYYALIGRTSLRHFSMHYDGRTGAVTISND